jgi:hypothetical protein
MFALNWEFHERSCAEGSIMVNVRHYDPTGDMPD